MMIGRPDAPVSTIPETTLDIELIVPTDFEKYKPHGLKVEDSTLEGVIIEVTSSSTIEREKNDEELKALRIMLVSIGASRSIASMGIKLHFQDSALLTKYLELLYKTIMASSSIIFLDLKLIDSEGELLSAPDYITGAMLHKNRELFLSRLKTLERKTEKITPIDLATLHSQTNLLCRLKVESWYKLDHYYSSIFALNLLNAVKIDLRTNTNMDAWRETWRGRAFKLTAKIRQEIAFAVTKMPLPPENEQADGTTHSFMLALLACNGGNYPAKYKDTYDAALSAMKHALTPDTVSLPPEMAEID
jgi:hypothetical protein